MQQFYKDIEQGFQNAGISFVKLENNTYELRHPDGNGYTKVVMQNDTVYMIYTLVDVDHWSSSKGALQEMINSFKVL